MQFYNCYFVQLTFKSVKRRKEKKIYIYTIFKNCLYTYFSQCSLSLCGFELLSGITSFQSECSSLYLIMHIPNRKFFLVSIVVEMSLFFLLNRRVVVLDIVFLVGSSILLAP